MNTDKGRGGDSFKSFLRTLAFAGVCLEIVAGGAALVHGELGNPANHPRVSFTDVTRQAGINFQHFHGTRTTQLPEDMGSGAAWGDYDNDGYPDLYVVDVAGPLTASADELAHSPGGNRLYHNNRDGTFTDVTARSGVGLKAIGMGAAWADYDHDGRLDLVVSNYGALVLYRNNGDGTFTDVSAKAGFDKFHGFWTGLAWGDYDRDGNVDLYAGRYVKYNYRQEDVKRYSRQYSTLVPFTLNPASYPPEPNLLFHNNGDGSFTEVAKDAGVDNPNGRTLATAWYDFDGDGWPDLYVANDIWASAMYVNLHNGKFKEVTREAGVSDFRGAMGIGIGDWNNDGGPDIFITHWIYQQNTMFENLRSMPGEPGKERKFGYADVSEILGVGNASRNLIGFSTFFFDYDNDGRLDLFVANGSTFQDSKDPTRLVPMKNSLYWQKSRDEGFVEVGASSGAGFEETRVGRGAAAADYDNDGDLDIFVVNHGGPPTLLRNDGGNRKNWLKVRVKCSKSTRTGFGTKVEVEAGGVRQRQEVGSQGPYLSQNSQEAHFGLGEQKQVTRVKVTFPSGVVRVLERLPANQTLTVTE